MSTQLCLALCTLFPMLRPLRNHQPTVSGGPRPGVSGPLEPFREGPAIEGAETHQLREQGPGCVGLGGPACRPLPLLPGGRQRRDQRLGPSSHRQPPPRTHTLCHLAPGSIGVGRVSLGSSRRSSAALCRAAWQGWVDLSLLSCPSPPLQLILSEAGPGLMAAMLGFADLAAGGFSSQTDPTAE